MRADYSKGLIKQVEELTVENERLKTENKRLRGENRELSMRLTQLERFFCYPYFPIFSNRPINSMYINAGDFLGVNISSLLSSSTYGGQTVTRGNPITARTYNLVRWTLYRNPNGVEPNATTRTAWTGFMDGVLASGSGTDSINFCNHLTQTNPNTGALYTFANCPCPYKGPVSLVLDFDIAFPCEPIPSACEGKENPVGPELLRWYSQPLAFAETKQGSGYQQFDETTIGNFVWNRTDEHFEAMMGMPETEKLYIRPVRLP